MTVLFWIILGVSIGINALLLWYAAYALKNLLFMSDNIGELLDSANSFAEHIEQVHEMETFYGDLTLQNLIAHSRQFVEDIKEFEEIYNLTEEGLELEDAKEEG
tara:strand:- start:20 stop:331 length:312 start_codon:yes stop_codon:yes gene_type:complete